jgi:subtilisin-like proprotein convertase family protein
MQTIFTKTQVAKLFRALSVVIAAALFMVFQTATAQVIYQNGNLSSGATTASGTVAPAGFQWSEIQGSNVNAGYSANISAGSAVADNFVVPAGQTWNITKIIFYAYSTNYTGATSPFNDVRVRLYNTAPNVGSPTPIFGDLTTNRFAASTATTLYRIFPTPANPPGTTRLIWRIEANVATTLAPGTYWVNWQVGTIGGVTSNFSPAKVVIGANNAAGDNGLQITGLPAGTWAALTDGTPAVPQDMPFDLVGTVTGSPCSTPAPGNTLSSLTASGCPGTPFNLSLQNSTPGVGVTHQWQVATALAGPYTNIAGATASTFSSTIAPGVGTRYYQCVVACATGPGSTGTSTPVAVLETPPTQCYCTTSLASSTADEDIFRVRIGGLDNASTCTSVGPGFGSILNRYSNYTSGTGAPAPARVLIGASNPIALTSGTCGGNFTNSFAVFIDLNQDGDFVDAGERVFQSAAGVVGPHTAIGVAVIPAGVTPTATGVPTRMRVVNVETGTPGSITPCGGYLWGETEDYNVNLVPCTPATFASQPVNATASCGSSANFSVTGAGDFPSFTWQFRTSATGVWQAVPAAAPYSVANTATGSTLTVVANNPAFNGYQYRALLSGACSAVDFSSPATLTITPIVASVTPTAANICNGSVQSLVINNLASPAPASQTFNSGPLSLAIADGNVTGVNHTINVSGIPAGAIVTNVTVSMNVTHTYVSDLMVVVRGPNNQILNLSNLVGGTNQAGANFVNTAFSSTATAALVSAPAPHTGTFRPDGAGAIGAFGVPGGPTGFTPTLPGGSLSAFHSLVNGAWTLAMFDAGPPDVGTLTGWSVKIDYLAGSPGTGVFTGTAGTLFTNAGATTAYTGTPINTVFVKPTTQGVNNYSVVYTDGLCVSAPLNIPVTVNNPIAGTATVANAAVCAGGNVSLTLGGTPTGGPIAHQWQVKTSPATPWVNVANNAIYTGATTATLNITGAPIGWSGYQYRDSLFSGAPCGSLISTVGTLTVNPVPLVTIGASDLTLIPGGTSVLSTAVSPNAAASGGYQWFLNGSPIPGANSSSYIANINTLGTYTVRVSDVNGCVSNAGASTPNNIVITDTASTKLWIYPNPSVGGQFEVRYYYDENNRFATAETVNVYDSKGSRVFSQQYAPARGYRRMVVNLAGAAKGIYRVDVITTQGERLATGSVMVN